MKVVNLEVKACSFSDLTVDERSRLHGEAAPDFVVVTIETDEGVSGTSLGFGGLDAKVCAPLFAATRSFLIGRDPLDHERNYQDYQFWDRRWNVLPIWVYGPLDVACWDIAGKHSGEPIHKLIGTARDRVPVYASSMFHADDQTYVDEALEVKRNGLRAYKLHPPGPAARDMMIYTAVREAVGAEFTLMTDPVATHDYDEAVRVGRHLEELGYLWFEEPLNDYDLVGLKRLSETLDIPIAATEAISGLEVSTASYLANCACDIVRADVSWRGGVTGVRRIASVAQEFDAKCEIHTSIYEGLEFGNLHAALTITNSDYMELLYPLERYQFGTMNRLPIEDGYVLAPTQPGLGVEYDWDAIDNATVAIF